MGDSSTLEAKTTVFSQKVYNTRSELLIAMTTPEHFSLVDLKQLFLDRKSSDEVNRSLNQFSQEVETSETFTWMGLFETLDRYANKRWVIYLQPKVPIPTLREQQLFLLPSFVNLALRMREKTFILDLAFTSLGLYQNHDQLIEWCRSSIRASHGENNPDWDVKMLWQSDFGKPNVF